MAVEWASETRMYPDTDFDKKFLKILSEFDQSSNRAMIYVFSF
jgi:hypothetical protein